MSALYLGTGKLEQYLLERLDNKLQTNKTLKMNLLMDYMRGTRVSGGESTLGMLKILKEKHIMRNLRIGFWHHPDTGVLKGKYFSGPMKEIFGVHHIKAHVFDHNVVITG
jgi:CDP-diacylglycerol---glycerol-3-phosphate 3-phosphatidyltransferase